MPVLPLSERLLLTRRRMGLTQSGLAKILRVCRETVNRIEKERGWRPEQSTIDRFIVLERRQRALRREKTQPDHRRVAGEKIVAP
jgi:predicted transcriptional regulator